MSTNLPPQVKMYFWGDSLEELNWTDNKPYIIQTLLDKGDEKAIQWLFQQSSRSEIAELLPTLKLQPKSRNFWQVYLS